MGLELLVCLCVLQWLRRLTFGPLRFLSINYSLLGARLSKLSSRSKIAFALANFSSGHVKQSAQND